MKKLILILILSLLSINTFAQKDDFVGFYKGEVEGIKKLPWFLPRTIYAEIHRLDETYRIRILGDIFSRADNFFIQDNLKPSEGKIYFSGNSDKISISEGIATPEEINLKATFAKSKSDIKLKRYNPPQESLGKKALKGAYVIFDGRDSSKLEHKDGSACQWEIKDSAISINPSSKKGAIYTKEAFGSAFFLHLEFMCPPDSYHLTGQKRNNSGIYIGDYELQILDSFGTESLWDDCGAIYRQTPPSVNACLEAGAWQSYDITFYPAEFDENDKAIKDPCITVHQNGIKIHDKTPIPTATAGASADPNKYIHPNKPLKIMLQEHKNKVQFRNIWLLPLEK